MGRPRKKETAKTTKEVKETKTEPEKPVYSHPSRKRCEATDRAYPSFLDKKCGAIMRAVKTTGPENSRKQWKCPKCDNVVMTEGTKV